MHFTSQVTVLFRFFRLLNVPLERLNKQTPFSVLANTLLYNGTPKPVKNFILQGVLNLLTVTDDDEEDAAIRLTELPQLKLTSKVESISKSQRLVATPYLDASLGTKLVLGHLPSVLEFLASNLPEDAKAAAALPNSYIEVLDRYHLLAAATLHKLVQTESVRGKRRHRGPLRFDSAKLCRAQAIERRRTDGHTVEDRCSPP